MYGRILIDNITKNQWQAEWGLSIYLEYEGRKILLDAGTTGKFAENADEMGIDLSQVEFGVLSHAHFDHSDGLEDFFARNAKAAFYLREGAKEDCYSIQNWLEKKYIGIRQGYLERFKDRLIYVSGDYEIVPGVFLLPHKTPGLEEVGKQAGMYRKEKDGWKPDGFDHEQSLVFDTPKGLVIFNSCSHGGADTIIKETAATFPDKKLYAMIGGFHLFRSPDEAVYEFAGRVRDTGIEKIYTGHCTGDRAMEILKEELGEKVQQIYTGLEILL